MKRFVVLILAMVPAAPFLWAQSDWKPEAKWSGHGKTNVTELIRQAEDLEKDGRFKKALKHYKTIEKLSVNLSNRSKAVVAQGRCLQGKKDYWPAFETYKRAVANYKNYISLDAVLQLEYQVADVYFGGYRDRLLFLSFNTDEKAVEIYNHIATSAPYSPIAADAMYQAGIVLVRLKYYDDAIAKFRQIIRVFPNYEKIEDCRIELARTLLDAADNADGDRRMIVEARSILSIFVKRLPGHARVEEAKVLLVRANEQEADHLLYLGEFYQRPAHARSKASRGYLQELLDRYPETTSASQAKFLLRTIEGETEPSATAATPATAEPAVAKPAPRRIPGEPAEARDPQTGKWLLPITDINAPVAKEK